MHDSNMYARMKYNEDNTAQWYIYLTADDQCDSVERANQHK